jgi:hypothetical protein
LQIILVGQSKSKHSNGLSMWFYNFGTLPYRFWPCLRATKDWELTFSFFYHFNSPTNLISWKRLWSCIGTIFFFSKQLPNKVKIFNLLWSLFTKVTLWAIWIEKNGLFFNNNMWHEGESLIEIMWERIIDMGCWNDNIIWSKSKRT